MNNVHRQTAKQLQQKSAGLIARLLKGKEPDFLIQHTRLLDDYFRQAFETSMVGPRMDISKNPYAIIALGGYGRQEQCVHSDVDLLLLFKTLAGKDFEVLTPLLDARFVCGWSVIYSGLMDELREKILRKKSAAIINWLVEKNEVRHSLYGDSAYLLEPNLKEGQGGLRDYHTMLWIARIEFNVKLPRDLEYLGLLSHEEFQSLNRSLAFIWNVRNRIHHICGRKCDRLYFENQIKLSRALNYRKNNGQKPVERFMGELHAQMEALKQQHLVFLH
ncbi:MAG: DUF294 nucleotidyltransferase-like domain-containing protein, partial [Desulfobacterales bacterium]